MWPVNNGYPCDPTNYKKGRKQGVAYLCIHYVGAEGSALNNAVYFSRNPGLRASAHYFVGFAEEGKIFSSVPEADTAWAVGATKYVHPACRNDNSISIEMCCHKDGRGKWYFDTETVGQTVALARDIVRRYNIARENLLRHHDVTGKNCPAPFVENEEAWLDFVDRVYQTGWEEEFAEAWDAATQDGIVDGTRPTDPVTRNELAVILRRLNLY